MYMHIKDLLLLFLLAMGHMQIKSSGEVLLEARTNNTCTFELVLPPKFGALGAQKLWRRGP